MVSELPERNRLGRFSELELGTDLHCVACDCHFSTADRAKEDPERIWRSPSFSTGRVRIATLVSDRLSICFRKAIVDFLPAI
jgi:hypothetical protein